ncbi:Natterin-4 [Paragonimus heterotremus]|uniref:Natterin-4 n=1 Tax=Paragonimus heterotremus TaxID=100268 RepID=A0A8J4WI29_9TREM|nr:Natterin-4 [Paragonimus heterotremus]
MAKFSGGYQMTLSWIPAKDGCLPERAVEAGNGVYVCRAKHNDEMIPGRLLPQNGRAYIPHGGLELPKEKYEVLCNTSVQCHKCFSWKSAVNGEVPKCAIIAGFSEDGSPLHIARILFQNECLVGKVHLGHPTAYFPYGGAEISQESYEVLVWEKKS